MDLTKEMWIWTTLYPYQEHGSAFTESKGQAFVLFSIDGNLFDGETPTYIPYGDWEEGQEPVDVPDLPARRKAALDTRKGDAAFRCRESLRGISNGVIRQ
jgi:hypothetical protein